MGLMKRVARVPWDLLRPVRERVVFRLLHYGRALLQPLEAEVRELQTRLPASLDALQGDVASTASTLEALAATQRGFGERLQAIESSLSALGSIDERLVSLPAIEHRLSALGDIDSRLGAIEVRVGLVSEHAQAAARRLQEQGEQLALLELGLRAVLRDLARVYPRNDAPAAAALATAGRSPDVPRLPLNANGAPAVLSYARNREDVLLARLFPEDHEGFYVDAGAGDPTVFSVSRRFYDRGWRGINVEPSRPLYDRLVEQRPRDVNLNIGLWDSESELTFYESQGETGCSSFRDEEATRARQQGVAVGSREVKVAPLAKVLEAYAAPEIDFLKVAVEGAELEVLRGNDWQRFRPRVLVVEARPAGARPETARGWDEEGEALVRDAGYAFATFDGLNRFYVRNEDTAWVDVLGVPPNVFDRFVPYEIVAGLDEHHRELQDLHRRFVALRARLETAEESIGAMLGSSASAPDSDA